MPKGERDIFKGGARTPQEGGPRYVLLDEDGNEYWSMKDAMVQAKLSRVRLQDLVREERIKAIRPGGWELFVSADSLRHYLEHGRRKPGRPPKSHI